MPPFEPGPEARQMLDLVPCGLMCTLADGTFLRANRIFCSWVGHREEDLVHQRKFQDLLTVGGRIFHQTHWAPLLAMQGSISEVKLELLQRNGTTLPIVVNAIARYDEDVKVHELAAYVARDRDKYEKELLASRRRMEELVIETQRLHEEAKDRALFAEQMIGIVSHDLRNPLSTISMASTMLARGAAPPAQERIVARIARATERADRLIGDLLDLTQARLGSGIAVNPEPIDLHALVADCLEELTLAHPGRTLRHAKSGEGECRADPSRLEQLIGNLVSNAIAYGDPEAPITITSAIESTHFSIAVHNLGPVIPPELSSRLFEPMQRGATAGPSNRSVGLGLFIVSQLCKAHGGKTEVHSSADAGTTFRMTFPRPDAEIAREGDPCAD